MYKFHKAQIKFGTQIAQNTNILCFLFLCFVFYLFFSHVCVLGFAQTVDPGKVIDVRAKLEAELAVLEAQIKQEEEIIKEKQRESTTLERDIAILDAQINKARLEIKARNLRISDLNEEISDRSELVEKLEQKLESEKVSLAELLRKINELDSSSLAEILFGYDKFSDFFSDFSSFEFIQRDLQDSFNEIKETQTETSKEKVVLEGSKEEELGLRRIQELEKQRTEQREAEKKNLLKTTKGEEGRYQKILTERKKDAASIRSQLFLLTGSPSIPFEKAVEYANVAFNFTGVRPAFLLGVIAEESNLGANIGTGNWKIDMHPTRDAPVFKQIAERLGLNPDMLPVSKKAWYGWGGAMGPAQFIPSTWVLYENRIAGLTGHNPPNPYEPLDAFVASALLLRDNGAAAGGYAAERKAALKYLAGSNWSNPSYAFYGDDVMALAAKYQEQIDIISGG